MGNPQKSLGLVMVMTGTLPVSATDERLLGFAEVEGRPRPGPGQPGLHRRSGRGGGGLSCSRRRRRCRLLGGGKSIVTVVVLDGVLEHLGCKGLRGVGVLELGPESVQLFGDGLQLDSHLNLPRGLVGQLCVQLVDAQFVQQHLKQIFVNSMLYFLEQVPGSHVMGT